MIISDKLKLIYVRIPKTGSTSLEKFIIENDPDCIASGYFEGPPYGHHTAKEMRDYVGEERWKSYFKFTVIREPIAWFKSRYFDQCQYHLYDQLELKLITDPSYKLAYPENDTLNVDHVIKGWIFFKEYGERPLQSTYIDDQLDYIGKLEEIDSVIAMLKNKYGFTNDLPNLNQTNSSKLSLTSNAETILNILLREDMNLYESIFSEK